MLWYELTTLMSTYSTYTLLAKWVARCNKQDLTELNFSLALRFISISTYLQSFIK